MMTRNIMKKVGTSALAAIVSASFVPTMAFADTTTTSVGSATELQSAIDDGTSSIALTDDITGNITIGKGESVTIDMNGYTINGASDSSNSVVTVDYGGTFNTEDGGSIIANADDSAAVFNSGTATLDDGITLSRSDDASTFYTVVNHGTMTIGSADDEDSAVVTTNDQTSSLIENGYSNYSSKNATTGYVSGSNSEYPTLTINDGKFTGGVTNIKNDDGGRVTIADGIFSGPAEENLLNYNVANVLGGEFTITVSDRSNINNNCLNTFVDSGVLVVSGGIFNADPAITSTSTSGGTFGTITVTGGTFAGDIYLEDSTRDQSGITINEDSIATTSTISSLQSQLATLNNKYDALNLKYTTLKNEYDTLNDKYTALKSKYTTPSKVTTIKATALKKGAKITFKKVSDATSYKIYRSTKKNGTYKYITSVKSSKNTITYTNKNLKSQKTYYYKVKAVKTSGHATITSNASKVVTVKTK